MSKAIRAEESRLTSLDSEVGDGDHGVNIGRALTACTESVNQLEQPSPYDVWQKTGSTIVNEMGGAAGVIFGSFFLGGAKTVREAEAMGLPEVCDFFAAGLALVQKRGKANPGDKTLVDALAPAVHALQEARQTGLSLLQALQAAAAAARQGAEATQDMVAGAGRARFLGERSRGFQDAGATSMAILIASWLRPFNETSVSR